MENMREPVILFDGVCNLCQGAVQFIIRRDHSAQFCFTSLQSDTGRKLLMSHGLADQPVNYMVLIENGKYYTRSTAALRIAKRLKWPWPLCYGLIIIPSFIRNAVYGVIASNRYKWFGKSESCMLPTPDIRSRFLEDE